MENSEKGTEEQAGKEIKKRKARLKEKFSNWLKDPYNKVFFIILIIAFAIRFWVFLKTIDQPLWYDAANFLATAKRWAGLDVNDIWYYRRGFLWVLIPAIFFKLGLGEIGIRFLEVIFSTGLVLLSYLLIKDMFNKKSALLVSIAMAFSWIILFFTGRPMTEIPASFFLLLSFLFFWKGYIKQKGRKFFLLFGLFFALALLTRFQYSMFAFPLFIFIFIKEKSGFLKNKNLWSAFLIFIICLIPFFIIYSQHYGFFVKDIFGYYLGIGNIGEESAATSKTFANYFDYFKDLPYMLTIYILIPFLVGIFYFFVDLFVGLDKIFKNEEVQKKLFVFLLIVIPFIALGRITDYVEQRYIMPVLPFLFLVSVSAFSILNLLKMNEKTKTILAVVILIGLLIPNLLWANRLIDAKKTSYLEVKQAGLWLKQNSQQGDIIISNSYPQIIYYAERATYHMEPHRQGVHYQNPELIRYSEGEKGFEEFVQEKKPKYLMLSVFEKHERWMYEYPEKHNDTLIPVQAYYQGQNPVVIIYRFKYG